MSEGERESAARRLRRIFRDVRQVVRAGLRGESTTSYDQLRESESLYRLMTESARDIIWMLEFPDRVTYVSPSCKRLLGWSPTEQYDRRLGFRMLTDDSAERAERVIADAIAERRTAVTYEAEHNRADGTTIWCEVHQAILYDESGEAVSCVGITRDLTETRALQEQLTVAQKAELVGALAGGVAHDFNNFLTVIIGSLDLVNEEIEKTDTVSGFLADAMEAAEKSAALTAQLLAFSRHQPVSIGAIDVNEVLRRSEALFDRLVGARIRLDIVLSRGSSPARADEHQLDQILLNLVMNARDAIEGDGCITIETANVLIDRELAARRKGVQPGRFVMIAVSDDGVGMDEETRARALDPFFSTKPRGRGTGLGLPMVQSIVERLGGDLSIYSEPGSGTTVKVYLPVADRERADVSVRDVVELSASLRGDESILVVEDESTVLSLACHTLRQMGYGVHAAGSPAVALEMIRHFVKRGDPLDLVLSDLVMPGMNGVELAEQAREIVPELPFVIMSGYAENGASNLTQDRLPGPLLTKPFHINGLLRTVRSALDERSDT